MRRFYISIISLTFCCYAGAQRANIKNAALKKNAKAAAVAEDPRLEEMRQSTQKIIFIDSVVVNKADILTALNQTHDAGTIYSFADFFKTDDDGDSFVFLNELGNKCFYSQYTNDGPTAQKELYASDLIGKEWSNTHKVTGLCDDGELTHKNYPFMMNDGTTLYFAAKGEESIGGWDIFVTRYDSQDNTYLKAENIGMPFNSTANDYFYIVDDINNIGWFASDRNQPGDKVCIYTFIPSESRCNYNADEMDEAQLMSLSSLHSIKDTWGNGSERNDALQRLSAAKSGNTGTAATFTLIINDNTVYTDYSQFKHKENAAKMKTVAAAREKLGKITASLETAREHYAHADAADKEILAGEILDYEQQTEELQLLVDTTEKDIRNTENR